MLGPNVVFKTIKMFLFAETLKIYSITFDLLTFKKMSIQ